MSPIRRLRKWLGPETWASVSKGVVVTHANLAVGIAANIVLVPFYLSHLGADLYGLWLTVLAITGYLSLASLGIFQSTANHFAAAYAREDYTGARAALASGAWHFALRLALIVPFILVVAFLVPWDRVFLGSKGSQAQAGAVLFASLACVLLALPFRMFNACLAAMNRIHENQAILIGQTVLRAISAVLVLSLNGTLVQLIVVLSGIDIAGSLVACVRLRMLVPGLSLARRHVETVEVDSIKGAGRYFLILQVSGTLAFGTDSLVIASCLGTGYVAAYGVAMRVVGMASGVAKAVSTSFGPVFLRFHARGDLPMLRGSVRKALWASSVLALGLTGALVSLGPGLIRLWVGRSNFVGLASWVVMVVVMGLNISISPLDRLLVYTDNHRAYAIAAIWEGLLNLGLSLLLVRYIGVLGVLLATLVARLVGAVPVVIWKGGRVIRGKGDALASVALAGEIIK